MKHLKLWTHPGSYVGAEWPDYYVVASQHRDSDTLTRSNWECWVKWMTELLGEESEITSENCFQTNPEVSPVPGWVSVRESHCMVGWVEWIGVHKDVSPEILAKIDEKLDDLDGYPVFDEDHFSEFEQREYMECFERNGADRDWIRELRRRFDEECKCARVLDFLEDKLDWNLILSIHEALIPSGEYHSCDNSGIWPHTDHSVEALTRNGLARLAWELKYRGRDGVYTLLARGGWNA